MSTHENLLLWRLRKDISWGWTTHNTGSLLFNNQQCYITWRKKNCLKVVDNILCISWWPIILPHDNHSAIGTLKDIMLLLSSALLYLNEMQGRDNAPFLSVQGHSHPWNSMGIQLKDFHGLNLLLTVLGSTVYLPPTEQAVIISVKLCLIHVSIDWNVTFLFEQGHSHPWFIFSGHPTERLLVINHLCRQGALCPPK